MKKTFTFFLTIFIISNSYSQNLSGKWTGYFKPDGEVRKHEFEIEFVENKGIIEALTHTKLKMSGKQFYNICKAKVFILKDSSSTKITVTEYEVYKGNNPEQLRVCFQKHTLILSNNGGVYSLTGTWEPAKKSENCGIGTTILTKNIE
jgi:hypothetical protein